MTVEHTADIGRKTYVASAGQTVFQFPIKVPGPGMLDVFCDAVTKIEGVHWSATGYGSSAGVEITFTDPMAGGEIVLILLDLPYKQDTDYVTGGRFGAEEHESALDYQHNLIRQLRDLLARGLRFVANAPSDHNDIQLPVLTGQGGKFLRIKAGGDGFEYVPATPSSGINLPIEDQDVNHTPPYTGAFNIGLSRAMIRDLKTTPFDFSATQLLRDGSFNSQPHCQAMMDAASDGEGSPTIPRGTWRWDSEVVADYRNKSTVESTKGFDIQGDGEGACVINYSGANGLRILTTPATQSWHTHARIGGFHMINTVARTGKGIYLDGAAYLVLHNISIRNASYAIDGVDVLSTTFAENYITGCLYGIRLQRNTSSRPNNLRFEGNTVGAWNYGCLLIEPSTVEFASNSWEGIGKLGADVNRFAIEVQGAGTIGGGISWDNEHFEGTHGLCDIRINSGVADCTYSVRDCTMQKTLPDAYPKHNIRVDQDAGDGWVCLSVENTEFSTHNGYVPDSANRVIQFYTSINKVLYHENGSNRYQNPEEMPTYANGATFAEALVNGSLAGPITPTRTLNIGAVTKTGTGHYVLPFLTTGRAATKIPQVNAVNAAPMIAQATNYDADSVTVKIWDITGTPVDSWFSIRVSD